MEFVEYRRTRDPALRDRLVERHVELAYWLAQRFAGRGEELDDLRQTALLALFKSVERFEPSYGVKFSTFATPTIIGELKRHLRDHRWAVRPPRPVQERALEVTVLVESLTHCLRRSPTVPELAAAGGFTQEQVLDAMEASSGYTRAPIELTDQGPVAGELAQDDPELTRVEDFSTIERLLRYLPERQRQIMVLRYFGNETQETIARRFGVSQMQVSRLLARGLRELRVKAGVAEVPVG